MGAWPYEMISISPDLQVDAWRRSNHRMGWGISDAAFHAITTPPELTKEDHADEVAAVVLFHGFGDDGTGNADAVASGRLAWEATRRNRKGRIWTCEHLDFKEPGCLRLWPGARPRPKGFYWGKVHTGSRYQTFSAAEFRARHQEESALSLEGLEMVAVTHSHMAPSIGSPGFPAMSLADYEVAPYGFGDYFDVPHLFFTNGLLALGLGHVDRNYPAFGIPTVRFP